MTISALIWWENREKTFETVKKRRPNQTSQAEQIKDQEMEYAYYCLGKWYFIVLACGSLILDFMLRYV